jgi:hypothetical protein
MSETKRSANPWLSSQVGILPNSSNDQFPAAVQALQAVTNAKFADIA